MNPSGKGFQSPHMPRIQHKQALQMDNDDLDMEPAIDDQDSYESEVEKKTIANLFKRFNVAASQQKKSIKGSPRHHLDDHHDERKSVPASKQIQRISYTKFEAHRAPAVEPESPYAKKPSKQLEKAKANYQTESMVPYASAAPQRKGQTMTSEHYATNSIDSSDQAGDFIGIHKLIDTKQL
jgi:hypothetical protein